jgi:aquaporin Z
MRVENAVNRYAAEFVGTFVLVLGGVGTAVLAGSTVGTLGVSLAFGLALLAMVYAVGPISGCHLNPAVTLALVLTGKTRREDALGYVVAQIAGAIAAAAVVLLVVKGAPGAFDPDVTGLAANGFGVHSPGGYNLGAAFVAEVVLTFVLVFTVLGATEVNAPVGFAGMAIGFVLALVHLIGIPVTNVSVNPARSIGPAVFVGGWALAQLWLFVVAPLLGSALAAAVHRTLHRGVPQLPARDAERALPFEEGQRAAGL